MFRLRSRSGFSVTCRQEFINIDDDNVMGVVVGHISAQHVRVFAMWAIALVLTGMAYAFEASGQAALALAVTGTAFAFICSIVLEAQGK